MNDTKISKKILNTDKILFVWMICFVLIFSFACGGGGGGGSKNDDEGGGVEFTGDATDTTSTDHIGIWEIVSWSRILYGEKPSTINLPYTFGTLGVEITGYADVTENSITLYLGIDNLPDGVKPDNGLYYCEDKVISYTINGDAVEANNGMEGTFEVSGDFLTLTIDSTDADTEAVVFKLSAADSSNLADAVADCSIYEKFSR